MKILYAKIENKDFAFTNQREKEEYLEENKNYKGLIAFSIIKTTRERTDNQNRALHLYFDHLAQELNSAGYTVQLILKQKNRLGLDERQRKRIIMETSTASDIRKKIDDETRENRRYRLNLRPSYKTFRREIWDNGTVS